MSKRKNSAVRTRENNRYTELPKNDVKTFYMNQSKTIDFSQVQPKAKVRKQVTLLPKSLNQEKYIVSLLDEETDIVVVSGPAGTGKTYLAMQAAIKALRMGTCEKIVLTRPAITVDDEKHGFLPGDLNAKMEPWTRPLIDVLKEYYSVKEVEEMLNEQIVEISPLAFMRGRTFKNSWIICDESQNCTISQMKMLLTRIGQNSKIIVTGDIEQSDRLAKDNGLFDLQAKLRSHTINGITACELTTSDVQRHRLISSILKMY